METKANYVIIGAFTFAVAVAAVLFGLFAARFATDRAWDHYEILFNESVIGLSDGSPVLYNGVSVGRVTEIDLNPEDVRQVLVTVEIDADVPIYTDTVATIRLTGLTGTAAIQLSGGTPDTSLLSEANAGRLPRIDAVASPLTRLLESSEGIVVTANDVMNRLSRLLSDDNVARVGETLAAVERFSAELNRPDSDLNRLLGAAANAGEDLPGLVRRLERAAARFTEVVDGVDRELVADLPELRERLENTLASLESVSGRIDTLLADSHDQLERLGQVSTRRIDAGLADLRRLIREMSTLVRAIERDPARFLTGGERPEEYPQQ
jgi:phospholipid/cholesterol/gamma-HCH transport system substrate-binding protein